MLHGSATPEGAMRLWCTSAAGRPAERAIGRGIEANKLTSSGLALEMIGE
jgi:hypothetical protein